jgi:hypothetical protein
MGLRILFACAAAALVVAAGAAPSPSPAGASAVATYRGAFLSFRHPAAWTPYVFPRAQTLHTQQLVDLSTEPARNPCVSVPMGQSCGWPIDRLGPGDVLVVWQNEGYPGWSLATAQGSRLTVGGRPARRIASKPGECSAVGADETISVEIARADPGTLTSVLACLRGPNLARAEARFAAVLATTRFHGR